ncbi:MAG: hypothetical protein R3332_09270 [Pseudohongiellaceae bacterium]|nr:hypothetical protein [Pseudohongiellaceae bacterium]
MSITHERFSTIVEAYGTDASKWPASEREAAKAYMLANPQAMQLFEEYRALEQLLDEHTIPSLALIEKRVIAKLEASSQKSLTEAFIDWLLPHSERLFTSLWRPALVASLPLIFGVYLSNFYSFGIDSETYMSMEEELYMLSLYDYAEPSQ